MHDTSHSHNHLADNGSSKRIGWAFALNFCFALIELVGGWFTNSTAIMADAVHDLGDSLSIGMAWVLGREADRLATQEYSYGFRRLSLLAALINAMILVIGSLWVLSEAIPRLANPVMPHAEGMVGLAILGVLVNGVAAYKLRQGKTLSEQVLNWHLLEDLLGWVVVLVVSFVLLFWQLPILDPLLSIFFTLFILVNVVKSLKKTLRLFLQAVPDQALSAEIRAVLLALPHVVDLHHMHLWSLDGEKHVLTAHLVLDVAISEQSHQLVKQQLNRKLGQFALAHTTIELEQLEETCRDGHP